MTRNDPTPVEGQAVEMLASTSEPTPESKPSTGARIDGPPHRTAIPGRLCPDALWRGSTPWADVIRPPYESIEALARAVGTHSGYQSGKPTHHGFQTDGIAWWVIDAMTHIYAETLRGGDRSYFELVPTCTSITIGEHAYLVGVAITAAGLVLLPIEEAR